MAKWKPRSMFVWLCFDIVVRFVKKTLHFTQRNFSRVVYFSAQLLLNRYGTVDGRKLCGLKAQLKNIKWSRALDKFSTFSFFFTYCNNIYMARGFYLLRCGEIHGHICCKTRWRGRNCLFLNHGLSFAVNEENTSFLRCYSMHLHRFYFCPRYRRKWSGAKYFKTVPFLHSSTCSQWILLSFSFEK